MGENKFKSIACLSPADLAGRAVLLRLDLNVPIVNGRIAEDFRLKKTLPTIEYLRASHARVIILGHLGEAGASLWPVADYFSGFFPIKFVAKIEDFARAKQETSADTTLVLENLRQDPGEEQNDPDFTARLASAGDIYVNDAFASSHREHASIVGLPHLLPSYAGFLLENEVKHLSRVFKPEHPFIVILGGAKFKTKLPLVKKLVSQADKIFIYGALAHAFFRDLGYELGESLVDQDLGVAKELLRHPKIVLPVDVRVRNGDKVFIKTPDKLVKTDNILDVGLESIEKLLPVIAEANFILWNGPLGNFEKGFKGSTEAVAKLIAGGNAVSIIGGGDTIAAIRELDLLNQFDFVSTGGGAMLDFLANGTLPGIEALRG